MVRKTILTLSLLILVLFVSALWQKSDTSFRVSLIYYGRLLKAQISLPHQATVKLDVKFHRQEHSLSCEVAALKMALSAQGIDLPESHLVNHLVFDKTQKENGIWGNPNYGFVGNIDGKMFIDGYGVYANPIANLGLRWRRTESFTDGTPQQLAHHLLEGNPVIAWGFVGRGNKGQWQTLDGQTVSAINGEHTRVIYGFSGIPDNPTGFFTMDPVYGSEYWDIESFMANWAPLGNMGVVVYPNPKWAKVPGDYKVWEISKDGKSRHWINMSWEQFVEYGGFSDAIAPIAREALDELDEGNDLML